MAPRWGRALLWTDAPGGACVNRVGGRAARGRSRLNPALRRGVPPAMRRLRLTGGGPQALHVENSGGKPMRTTRSFTQPGRSLAVGERGMVATSHPAATVAAHDVLRDGGNAVDAAIAAVAVQCVVDPHMTGVGGDCFALYAPKGGAPIALNGSGRAPAAATLDWYAERGVTAIPDEIPTRSRSRARSTPGAACMPITAACRWSACSPLRSATPRTASDHAARRLRLGQGGREAGPPRGGGHPVPAGRPGPGGRRPARPAALGATLRAVARHGRAAFYEGPVAEEIVATLRARAACTRWRTSPPRPRLRRSHPGRLSRA